MYVRESSLYNNLVYNNFLLVGLKESSSRTYANQVYIIIWYIIINYANLKNTTTYYIYR